MQAIIHQFVSSRGCIYESVNRVSIGSDNDLSPIRRQAIIYTNAGLLLIGTLGTDFSEILIKVRIFLIHENLSKTIVCEMVAIWSCGRWVKANLH